MGPDLSEEFYLAASQGPAGPETAAPGDEEAQQLPDPVDTQASGLDRIAEEVTLKEPVVEGHIALRNDSAAGSLALDLLDPVDHEHGRQRQTSFEALRRIGHEASVTECQQLFFGKALALQELRVVHDPTSKRSR